MSLAAWLAVEVLITYGLYRWARYQSSDNYGAGLLLWAIVAVFVLIDVIATAIWVYQLWRAAKSQRH